MAPMVEPLGSLRHAHRISNYIRAPARHFPEARTARCQDAITVAAYRLHTALSSSLNMGPSHAATKSPPP
jgi:hypothetical protein